MVIGNFCWKSESRYMKELVNWHLYYRTREELLRLGRKSFGTDFFIEVLEEEEGVNLFLRVVKES